MAIALAAPVFLLTDTLNARAQSVMGTCTWIKGNSQPRRQSCTIKPFNSGRLTVTTYRRTYVFDPYSSRGGFQYDNRIFQLHGQLAPDVSGRTSFSLISVEDSKPFRKLEFQSENP